MLSGRVWLLWRGEQPPGYAGARLSPVDGLRQRPSPFLPMAFEFDAELWRWEARTETWTFVSLPTDVADEVLDLAGPVERGFGSVRVEVTIGTTVWRTSIFPSSDTYVLPVKKSVRAAEGLSIGDTVRVRIHLVDLAAAAEG